MTGAVKAAQSAAWLPFAADAARHDRRGRVAHALSSARYDRRVGMSAPGRPEREYRSAENEDRPVTPADRLAVASFRRDGRGREAACARGSSARGTANRRRRNGAGIAADVERSVALRHRARRGKTARSPIRRTCRSRSAPTISPRRSASIRSSSSPARPARARRRSCRRSASRAGRGERGLIGHTQPRRIAARVGRRAHRAGARHAARRGGRLQGPLHRPHAPRRVRQADDRRHPARRDAGRPRPRRATTRSSSTRRTSAASTSTSCSAT